MPDASKLSFPVQLVIFIVTTVLAAAGSVWATQYGLRSDVRDILTRQELQVEVQALQSKLQEERAQRITASLADTNSKMELQRLKIEAITLTLAEKGLVIRGM